MSAIYFTKDHEWIRVEGREGTVGITDYAQKQLGDIVYVELPETGRTLTQGAEAAVVESVKSASEVKSAGAGMRKGSGSRYRSSPRTGVKPTPSSSSGHGGPAKTSTL